MSHLKRFEFEPVSWSREPPRRLKPSVKRRCRQRDERAKDRQTGRPGANLLKRALGHAWGIVIQPKNERGDRQNVALRQPFEHGLILARLVESLVDVGEVRGVNGFHADEYPFAP